MEFLGMPVHLDKRLPKCPTCGNDAWIVPTQHDPVCTFCHEPAPAKTAIEIMSILTLGGGS